MLRIALPNKGRLAQDTRDLFNDAGLDVRMTSDRALTASLGGEFEAIFVRAQDVPEVVADGAAHAGVTGADIIAESERPLESRLDLEYGACRLVVAAREESRVRDVSDLAAGSRVATVFPRITARFFAERKQAIDVVPVSGAAETAPLLGIADVIMDLVSTGSTLRSNGLREICTVMPSTARLITAVDRSRWSLAQCSAIEDLTMALGSVVRARGKRYLMANVPRAMLGRVKEVLPGLNGPTVIDILNGGTMVAVHAVVAASSVYRTISSLKALGAEGILLTRIERLAP